MEIHEKCPEDYIEVTSDWCITVPDDAPVVLRNAARDLEDYFFVSMGISLKVIREGEWNGTQKRIVYGIDSAIKEYSYRFAVAENEIILCGTSDRMAAQAGYFLEDLMNLCEAYSKTSLVNPGVIVDANHANSGKKWAEQPRICKEIIESTRYSKDVYNIVKGLMIES